MPKSKSLAEQRAVLTAKLKTVQTQSIQKQRSKAAQFLKQNKGSSTPKWFGKNVSSNFNQTPNVLSQWRKLIVGLSPIYYSTKSTPQAVWEQSDQVGLRIFACTLTNPCQSALCPACRTRKQDEISKSNLSLFGNFPIEHVYFLTVLFPIQPNPHITVPAIIQQQRQTLQKLIYKARRSDRTFNDVVISGAFEIDIKCKDCITHSTSKSLLQQLGMSFRTDASNAFLVHVHALVYSAGLSQQAIRKVFSDHYGIKRQVLLKKLYANQSLSENITHMSRYILKTRTSYATNLYASSNSSSKRVYSNDLFEQEDLVRFASALDQSGNIDFTIKAKK
jgi:hypothetical protein